MGWTDPPNSHFTVSPLSAIRNPSGLRATSPRLKVVSNVHQKGGGGKAAHPSATVIWLCELLAAFNSETAPPCRLCGGSPVCYVGASPPGQNTAGRRGTRGRERLKGFYTPQLRRLAPVSIPYAFDLIKIQTLPARAAKQCFIVILCALPSQFYVCKLIQTLCYLKSYLPVIFW